MVVGDVKKRQEQKLATNKPKTDTVINMHSIDAKPLPSVKAAAGVNDVTTDKEELSLQVETAFPQDSKGTVKQDVASLQAKHPRLRHASGRPLEELVQEYPDIPSSVLKKLSAQSEATIAITHPYSKQAPTATAADDKHDNKLVKSNVKYLQTQLMLSAKEPSTAATASVKTHDTAELLRNTSFGAADQQRQQQSCDSADVTPYSSMTDLSVKDKVKLLTQQLKPATK